jgi:hypothetical protein
MIPDVAHQEFEKVCAKSKRLFIARGSAPLLFIIVGHDGTKKVIAVPSPSDAATKRQVFSLIHLACTAFDAMAYLCISEAWERAATVGDSDRPTVMPSEAEDRKEVLMVIMIYRDETGERRTLHRIHEIIRDWKTGAITLRDMTEMTDENFQGILVDILPEKRPSPAQRTAAQIEVNKLLTERALPA